MRASAGRWKPYGCARAVLALGSAGLAAVALGRLPASARPQIAQGGGVLAVAFGDARETLGAAMVRKANSYYHGGVDTECPTCGKGCAGHEHGHGHGEPSGGAAPFSADPWRWVNSRIQAPNVHRHLEAHQSAELLPFYWAAVRLDPHNAGNWTTAIFIAESDLEDREMARRLIAEAKEANPGSAEIAFAEGRFLWQGGQGDPDGARRALERAKKLLSDKGETLSEKERALMNVVNAFLDGMRAQRNQ